MKKFVRAKALIVASCMRYGLSFSKLMENEKVSDSDVKRANYYLNNHSDWVPKIGIDSQGNITLIWKNELIDGGLIKITMEFIGGGVLIKSPARFYGGYREGTWPIKELLKEVKEKQPLGVCENCGDRVAYNISKEMKLCDFCIKKIVEEGFP